MLARTLVDGLSGEGGVCGADQRHREQLERPEHEQRHVRAPPHHTCVCAYHSINYFPHFTHLTSLTYIHI